MYNQDISKVYKEHSKMLDKAAWRFSCIYQYSFSEFRSECDSIFMHTISRYKPNNKTKFSTFLYRVLDNGLKNFAKSMDLNAVEDGDVVQFSSHKEWDPLNSLIFKELLSNLSEDSKTIADIITTAPSEIIELVAADTPKSIRGKLAKHLKQSGWSWPRIWRSFRELKMVLS